MEDMTKEKIKNLIDNGDVTVKLNQELTLDVGHRSRDGKLLYSSDGFDEDKETLSNTTTHTYKVVGIMERLSRDIEPLPAPGYSAFIGGKPESITGYKNTTSIVPPFDLSVASVYVILYANLGIHTHILPSFVLAFAQ